MAANTKDYTLDMNSRLCPNQHTCYHTKYHTYFKYSEENKTITSIRLLCVHLFIYFVLTYLILFYYLIRGTQVLDEPLLPI